MGMLDTSGKVLPSFEAFRDFDPYHPAFPDTDTYIRSLYHREEKDLPPAGTNLINHSCFENGLSGWWVNVSSPDVQYEAKNNELLVSSVRNFSFMITRDIRIDRAGRILCNRDTCKRI